MILLNKIISFIWELYMSKDNSDSVKIWTEGKNSTPNQDLYPQYVRQLVVTL